MFRSAWLWAGCALVAVGGENPPPVISDIPDQVIDEGDTFAVFDLDDYVEDPNNTDPELSWSWEGESALTVDYNAVTHVVEILIPHPDWFGSETITFTVTDPGLEQDLDDATFTVNAVNDPPDVTDIPSRTIDEGDAFAVFDLDDYVDDPDNTDAELSWSWEGEADLTVDYNAVTHVVEILISHADWFGAETITFTATDPGLEQDLDGATFTVNAVNDPPEVSDIPSRTIDEGDAFTSFDLDDYVADPDNTDAELSWSWEGESALTVDYNAVTHEVSILTPHAEWFGSETIEFTVTDPGLEQDLDSATFTVNAVNDPPAITDIPDRFIDEGDVFASFDLDDFVSDVDNGDAELSWSWIGEDELTVDYNAVTHVVDILIPHADWFGAETIEFTVTDPGLEQAIDAATFSVDAVNDLPVVGDIPDQVIDEGEGFALFDLDDYVEDVDNTDAELSWTWEGESELVVDYNAVTHVVDILIPHADWFGAETIEFTVTDPDLEEAIDAATFSVNAINDGPVVGDVPDQTVDEGGTFEPFDLDDYVDDVDNTDAELAWSWIGESELAVDYNAVTHMVDIVIPHPEWFGSETIIFTATDPELDQDFDDATFTVNPVYELVVQIEPPQGGTVTTDPGPPYALLDDVTLQATPSAAWRFFEWSGDLEGAANPDTITIGGDESVTAHFRRIGDVDGNGIVNVVDVLDLLALWGTDDRAADFDGSGVVDVVDFLDLLAHWD